MRHNAGDRHSFHTILADDPDSHLITHQHHPVGHSPEDPFLNILSAATDDNSAVIVDQGLAKDLAAGLYTL
jgi:hypothetical protein